MQGHSDPVVANATLAQPPAKMNSETLAVVHGGHGSNQKNQKGVRTSAEELEDDDNVV